MSPIVARPTLHQKRCLLALVTHESDQSSPSGDPLVSRVWRGSFFSLRLAQLSFIVHHFKMLDSDQLSGIVLFDVSMCAEPVSVCQDKWLEHRCSLILRRSLPAPGTKTSHDQICYVLGSQECCSKTECVIALTRVPWKGGSVCRPFVN